MTKWLVFLGLFALCGSAHAGPFAAAIPFIPTILQVAGPLLGMAGAASVGGAAAAQATGAANQADYQAAQLDQQAGQTRASSQRTAIDQRRQAKIAQSNLQAATGGGSSDASILGLTGQIAGEGEYNALTAMYEGEEQARGTEMQATSARGQARQYRAMAEDKKSASGIGGLGGLLSAGSTLFSKFGSGGPSASGDVLGDFIKAKGY